MNINQINRWTLRMWLRGVRFPLTVVETVVRRGDDMAPWPPALAFEMFEGKVNEAVGRITRDDTLLEMASLQRAEVALRRQAMALESHASSTIVDVERTAEAEKARLDRRREAADQRSRARKAQAEAERKEAQRALNERTANKRSATKATAATRAKTIDRRATKADAERLRTTAQALRAKTKAVAGQGKVLKLDKAVRAKKAARRAG